MSYQDLKVGDEVIRLLGGCLEVRLVVTEVTDTEIRCGDWSFCRKTGAEIDEDLQWGPKYGRTGSYLRVP
jgi:hypothetical protein